MKKYMSEIYEYIYEGEAGDIVDRAKEVVTNTVNICTTIIDNDKPQVKG